MTKENVLSWMRQIATMKNVVDTMSENIDQLKGNLAMVVAVDNKKQEAAIHTDLDRLQRDREKMLAEVLHRVNTSDIAGVETRLADMQIRLEVVDTLFEQWRRRLAQYELLSSTNGFSEDETGGVTRKQLNDLIDNAKSQYEQSLESVSALIPNKAVLLL